MSKQPKKSPKRHKLKRLSLKPLSFKEAVKLFVNTTKDDLKKTEDEEKR